MTKRYYGEDMSISTGPHPDPLTGNDMEVQKIKGLSVEGLLDYVMSNPEYVTDGYYSVFNDAIDARYAEILARRTA